MFQHLSAVTVHGMMSFCDDAVVVATNTCGGVIAGSDTLSAYICLL